MWKDVERDEEELSSDMNPTFMVSRLFPRVVLRQSCTSQKWSVFETPPQHNRKLTQKSKSCKTLRFPYSYKLHCLKLGSGFICVTPKYKLQEYPKLGDGAHL